MTHKASSDCANGARSRSGARAQDASRRNQKISSADSLRMRAHVRIEFARSRCSAGSQSRRAPAQIEGRNIERNERRDELDGDIGCRENHLRNRRMSRSGRSHQQRQTEAAGGRWLARGRIAAIAVDVSCDGNQPEAQRKTERDDARALPCSCSTET